MNKAALFGLLWLLDLQLKWTQRNKEFWTQHQRENFKIGAGSHPISYSQISPSAAESLQELVASGPVRAGKRWVDGCGGGLLRLPGCTSFIFLISGGGVWGVKTEPKDMKIRDRTWTSHQEGEEVRRREGGGVKLDAPPYHPPNPNPSETNCRPLVWAHFWEGGWNWCFRSALSKTGSDSDLNRKSSAPSADLWPENIRICSETDAFYSRKDPPAMKTVYTRIKNWSSTVVVHHHNLYELQH